MRILLGFITLFLFVVHPLQAAEKSLFWQLESPQGKISYLFGTIHTDDNRVTDFSPGVINALKSVNCFVMEVSETPDRQILQLPQGDLTAHLSENEISQVRALSETHVMAFDQVIHMKPWLLAVIFDLPKPQTPFAQDYLLKSKAEELDKQIEGLETVQEHFGAMDSFSLEDQLVMLRAVLKRSQIQKEKDFERLMHAYLSGDAERVTNIDLTLTKGMLPDALWQRMRVKLLDERNVVMAQRSVEKAQGGVFIAVGAAHLSGKTGLLQAFRKAGFKLTPLKK